MELAKQQELENTYKAPELVSREGLPTTNSHMESTVKEINGRIKGTEKFGQKNGSDSVLQRRGDDLSDRLPIN